MGLMLMSCQLFNNPLAIKYPKAEQGFSESINWYSAILDDDKASIRSRARAHLRLALLHSHYRNPNQNYTIALEHAEASVTMDIQIAANDNAVNFIDLLRSAADKSPGGFQAINKLKGDYKTLKSQNQQLRKTIEKLNELEVELEKRRKHMREPAQ